MTVATAEPPAVSVDLSRYDQSWYRRGRSGWLVVLWDFVQSTLIHGSLHPMYAWRRFWFRLFGARIGRGVKIRRSVVCTYPWNLRVGDNAWIGDQATLFTAAPIDIGESAVVSQQAYLCTGTHDIRDPAFGLVVEPVTIGRGAWVALGALVMPGVKVGDGAVVGARAILTRDAEPWSIYVGHPAVRKGPRRLATAAGQARVHDGA